MTELKNTENKNMKNENILLMEKIGNMTLIIKQLEKELFDSNNKINTYGEELDKL